MRLSQLFSQKVVVSPKAGALLLALLLWVYVGLNETYSDEVDCRIETINLKSGRIIANSLPANIKLSVSGTGFDLMWLNLFWSSDLVMRLDLTSINNYYNFQIKNERYLSSIAKPRNFRGSITVDRVVSPDTITVVLDEFLVKKLPLSEGNITILPDDGYIKVGSLAFEPDSIEISGPRRYIQDLTVIETEIISFDEEDSRFSENVKVIFDENVAYQLSESEVKFTADIQKIGQFIVKNVSVSVINRPLSYEVEIMPSMVDLNVTGGVNYIKRISPGAIEVIVRYDRNWRRGGEYIAKPEITLPAEVLRAELIPGSVRVGIK